MDIVAAVPKTTTELAEAIRGLPRVIVVGANTKPRLSCVNAERISTTGLCGIVEYEPDEFTFTALAGTPVRDIDAALAEKGQYLPFDPLLLESGATIGGTVASGLSGPGRFRFGGVRDFILGVRFVDGAGRLLRMGGKVVKNAAGFDLPKFFVGSLGRFGVLAEITFKVFPRAEKSRTLKLTPGDMDAVVNAVAEIARSRWEAEALEILPDGTSVLVRFAAPEPALDAIASEVLARWAGTTLSDEESRRTWSDIREFRWAHDAGALIKIPVTIADITKLHRAVASPDDTRLHVGAGGNVAFLSSRDGSAIDSTLRRLNLTGMFLRGRGPLWCGKRENFKVSQAVKEALDPQHRFPSLED